MGSAEILIAKLRVPNTVYFQGSEKCGYQTKKWKIVPAFSFAQFKCRKCKGEIKRHAPIVYPRWNVYNDRISKIYHIECFPWTVKILDEIEES